MVKLSNVHSFTRPDKNAINIRGQVVVRGCPVAYAGYIARGPDVGIRIDVPVGVFCPLGDNLGTLQLFCSPHSTTALFYDLSRPISYHLELGMDHESVQPVSVRRSECEEGAKAELVHPRGGRARAKVVVFDEWGNPLVTALAGHG